MDWEALRNIFLQYMEEQLQKWDKDFEKAYRETIQKLKETGYEVTPEIENQLNQLAKEKVEEVQNLIKETASSVMGLSLNDQVVDDLVKEVFNYRYPDGLNLSERLWDWGTELKHGLKKSLQNALVAGRSADAIVYELQDVIDSFSGQEKAVVLKEKIPQWVEELKRSAKRALKDPAARKEFEERIKKAQKYVENISSEESLYRTKTLFKQFKKAINEGKEYLIDKAIQYHMYNKQLTRLKTIARTESANAYHKAQIKMTEDDKDLIGYRWKLSKSHPKPDICDLFANINYGYGKGIHSKDKVPRQKAHPNCMCYLEPVYKWEVEGEEQEPIVERKVLKKFALEYVKDLEEVGIDIEQLFDERKKAFRTESELKENPAFEPLRTIGRVKRKGKWKKVKVKGLKKVLEKKLGHIPQEVQDYIQDREEINSLMEHYFKRKYLPEEPTRPESPKDLEEWINKILSNEKSVVLQMENRYIISDNIFLTIIEKPDKKITVFQLKKDLEQWKKENPWQQEIGTIKSLKKKLNI